MASIAGPSAGTSWWIARGQELALPVALIASVLVILVPIPSEMMDVLLAANVTVAVIILLTTISIKTPLEFSIFPSLLLVTTLARLVLNIATTRLILTRAASDGLMAAGSVVASFGGFVAGDNVIVGLVIFSIIVVIQFVVITKGATRISEVAARFALDGMPGRQMAIDADLNAGIIDDRQAQTRREEVTRQADFYGAMDGASKFVRGDAVAALVITVVNIFGGLAIGIFEAGMSFSQAASLFTKLTIGDGLVSQVPALLISLAAGLLVTRSTQRINLPLETLEQLFSRPQALAVTSVFLGLLMFTSMPAVPLLAIGSSCAGMSLLLNRRQQAQAAEAAEAAAQRPVKPEPRVEDYLLIDPMEIEIGVGLVRLADPSLGGDLLERIGRVRQSMAADIGILMPKVRVRDNMRLDQNQYRVKISDMPVAQGQLFPGMLLAIETDRTSDVVDGSPTKEPAFGTPARWINAARREQAERFGYTIVEPVAVLATHLTEIVRRNADEILTRDATQHLIQQLKTTSPAVVDELIPGVLSVAQVQQILQMLLREQVPIRQLSLILEALGDHAVRTKDPILLVEAVRQRLARTLCTRYRDPQNCLHVVTLDPAIEDRIAAGCDYTERGLVVRLSPQEIDELCQQIREPLSELTGAGHWPVVLVSPQVRYALKLVTEPHLPQLIALSYNEITRDTLVQSASMVT